MHFLWPAISVSGSLPRSLAALLPNRNHNADAFAKLNTLAAAEAAKFVLPLFLADPFLNVRTIVRVLQGWDGLRLAALPSVDQYGADFGKSLESLGVGTTRERRNIAALRGVGLHVIRGVAFAPDDGTDLRGETSLLILPRFDDPSELGWGQVLQTRAAAVQQVAPWITPIVLFD